MSVTPHTVTHTVKVTRTGPIPCEHSDDSVQEDQSTETQQKLVCTLMRSLRGRGTRSGGRGRRKMQGRNRHALLRGQEGEGGYDVGCCAHGAYGVRSARPLSHICRSWRVEHRKRNFLPRIVESTAKGEGVRGEG